MKLVGPSRLAALTLSFILLVGGIPSVPSQEHAALLPADECDWIGSGGGGRGVRPVYLRCSRGTVLWRYPRGALRIVLSVAAAIGSSAIGSRSGVKGVLLSSRNGASSETGAKGSSGSSGFRVCVKASGPARIYLENNGTLRPVYSPRDGRNEASHRCFYTKKQRTALYVEADELTANNNRAKLQYDVEPLVVNRSTPGESDEEAECRPCSMEELAEAYCQSDLVARGTVTAVQRKPELEAAELIFRITKTLRRVDETETNEVFSIFPNPRLEKNVRIRVSSTCDARHGQGEFVIMARRRLGDLTLVCAPRLETWAEAVRESVTAPCLLKS